MAETITQVTITIPLQYIYDEVDSRTYYEGEALKRKDVDYVSIQTGDDDHDQLLDFISTACNDIHGEMIKRVKDFEIEINEDSNIVSTFTPYTRLPESDYLRASKVMGKAMQDYIVNKCILEWKKVVMPSLVAPNAEAEEPLMWKIGRALGMVAGIIRRRAATLGI